MNAHSGSFATPDSAWLIVALCPAIAVSDLAVNAIGLGIAALVASVITCLTALLLKSLPASLRWLLCTLVLATVISCIALTMEAWLHDLHAALGVFLPLLTANLAIQWRAEQIAADSPVLAGLRTGMTLALILLLLGVARELVGHGSLLHSSATLLAGWTSALDQQLFDADMGFLLAMLPPGAFISFGVLLAARNWIAQRRRHE